MPKEPAETPPAEPSEPSAATGGQTGSESPQSPPLNAPDAAAGTSTQPLLPTRYRFTTRDGQTHESTASPDAIAAAYPGAAITHTVETDQTTGESTLTPYSAEGGVANGQPRAELSQPADAAAQDTTAQDTESAEPTQESSGTP